MAGRVEHFELYRASHLDDVTTYEASVYTADDASRAGVRQHFRAGRGDDTAVAIGVITMLVRIEDLRDAEAPRPRHRETLTGIQRIDDQRLTGLGAGDEIVEIAQRVRRPDAFDEHGAVLRPK